MGLLDQVARWVLRFLASVGLRGMLGAVHLLRLHEAGLVLIQAFLLGERVHFARLRADFERRGFAIVIFALVLPSSELGTTAVTARAETVRQ